MRKSKNKSLSKAKADKYFSEYIRRRDVNNGVGRCITCGELKPYDKLDAGHFISRRYQATRFDEKNCHIQCQKCNRFENGNQFEHGLKIDEIYGEGTAEKLLIKSKMLCKRNQADYEAVACEYARKLGEL